MGNPPVLYISLSQDLRQWRRVLSSTILARNIPSSLPVKQVMDSIGPTKLQFLQGSDFALLLGSKYEQLNTTSIWIHDSLSSEQAKIWAIKKYDNLLTQQQC